MFAFYYLRFTKEQVVQLFFICYAIYGKSLGQVRKVPCINEADTRITRVVK